MSVRVRDLGWARIKHDLYGLDKQVVKVGLQMGDKAPDESTTLAEIGAYQEFGTSRIPRRPFLSGAFEQYRNDLGTFKVRLLNLIYDKKLDYTQALAKLGQRHEDQVKNKITAGPWVPNAESTIRQKGSSKPLIDDRDMTKAVRYVIARK